jgi:hypothetical protein
VGALEDSMKREGFEVAQLECLWKWDSGGVIFFLFFLEVEPGFINLK